MIIDSITQIEFAKQYNFSAGCNRLMDFIPAGIYLKDRDLKYLAVNKAFCNLIGKQASDIVGRTNADVLSKSEADKYLANELIVLKSGLDIDSQEIKVTDCDDNVRWLSISIVPLHSDKGGVIGLIGMAQDTTELHLSRQQLMQSDKLAVIGTLAAGVAHEINNPIGYINSNLNTMLKYLEKISRYMTQAEYDDSELKLNIKELMEDFRDAVNESIQGAVRVRKIVADLKSFSRADRAEKELADINEGIDSTLNIVWNDLKYKCKVEKELNNLPDLFCIPNQLNQVFLNLLVNAGQAIKGSGGLIKIKTWHDDGHIYISVKDNGCGIPKDKIGKIFEPFYTTKDVGKGTGLGLSLAYDIIRKHAGSIEVKSDISVGSEFIISLPLGVQKNDS